MVWWKWVSSRKVYQRIRIGVRLINFIKINSFVFYRVYVYIDLSIIIYLFAAPSGRNQGGLGDGGNLEESFSNFLCIFNPWIKIGFVPNFLERPEETQLRRVSGFFLLLLVVFLPRPILVLFTDNFPSKVLEVITWEKKNFINPKKNFSLWLRLS